MAYHSPPLAPFVTRASIHSIGSRKDSFGKDIEDEGLLGIPRAKGNFATDYGPPPLEELKNQDSCYGYYDTYPKFENGKTMEWGAVKLCAILMGMIILLFTFGYYWIFIQSNSNGSRQPVVAPLASVGKT